MGYRKLQWLFPIAVALHNGEEALWMPGWIIRNRAALPVHPPGAMKIRLSLLALALAAFILTWMSERKGPGSIWAYLAFGYIITMLANVFVPHVPASVIYRGYTPGLVTAVLVNLPLMSYLALRALRDRWVRGAKALLFGVGVPLLAAILVGVFVLGVA